MLARETVPALCIERLVASYGAKRALQDVELRIQPGDSVALVGTNGAGKTTLLKCVLDLMLPDSGRVEIFGVPNRDPNSRKRLAYLPERFSPPHHLLGREFLQMALSLGGGEYDRAFAVRQLEELELEPDVLERPARQLSKGQTQKLGLVATFLAERDFYILDEPLEGLDVVARLAVKRVLARLRGAGRTLLFTSHVLADVAEVSSLLVVLAGGAIRFRGAPAELCARYGDANLEQAFVNCVRSTARPAAPQGPPAQ